MAAVLHVQPSCGEPCGEPPGNRKDVRPLANPDLAALTYAPLAVLSTLTVPRSLAVARCSRGDWHFRRTSIPVE